MLVEKYDKIIIETGRQWRVFAFTLIRRDKTILWIGSTMDNSAEEAAKKASARCEYAKNKNYMHDNGRSIGCTSLIDLIHINDR